MDNNRLLILLNKYRENTCTQEELKELDQWYDLLNTPNEAGGDSIPEELAEEMLAEFKQKLLKEKIPVMPLYRKFSFRIAAAASIIILLGITTYFKFFKLSGKNDMVKTVTLKPADVMAPGVTKATITLADGQIILLDSMNKGTILQQGNVNLTKTADGQIVYTGSTAETTYNTLTNPRGSTVVHLTLNDGTKVWLNSESSLKYPVAFAGNKREVTITGEAYFEVAKDASRHFFVEAGAVITEVLGTHFNVNSYSDEAYTKITLLEGAVKVTKADLIGLLKPGQQAQVGTSVNILNDVNTDEVMAWKEGKFQFGEKADVANIMRQISRWYDVEVEYRGTITGHIGGGISREVNASQVLKMLEATGVAKFRIDGRKVTVSPQ